MAGKKQDHKPWTPLDSDVLRIAAETGRDPRTVARVLNGESTKRRSRIDSVVLEAAKRLKVQV